MSVEIAGISIIEGCHIKTFSSVSGLKGLLYPISWDTCPLPEASSQQEKIEFFLVVNSFLLYRCPGISHRKQVISSLATILLAEQCDEVDRTIR
jgi:hypothetical protein